MLDSRAPSQCQCSGLCEAFRALAVLPLGSLVTMAAAFSLSRGQLTEPELLLAVFGSF